MYLQEREKISLKFQGDAFTQPALLLVPHLSPDLLPYLPT